MMKKLCGVLLVILLLTLYGCGGGGGGSHSPVNKELTADANTVALWLFNEGSGQTVADSSGNGRDLVLGNSTAVETKDPAWVSAGRSGFGQCLAFTASQSDWAYRDTGISFPTDCFTIEGWIKTTSSAQSTFFGSTGQIIEVQLTSDGKVWFIIADGGGWQSITSTGAVNDGQWHYVACTYNHAKMKIFIDGAIDNSDSFVIDVSDLSDYYVGGRYYFLDGYIDSMRISNVARTALAISTYYQATQ